jgi:hypothetical protein
VAAVIARLITSFTIKNWKTCYLGSRFFIFELGEAARPERRVGKLFVARTRFWIEKQLLLVIWKVITN